MCRRGVFIWISIKSENKRQETFNVWFDKCGKQRGESDCISGRNVVTLFSDNRIEVFPGGERRAGF